MKPFFISLTFCLMACGGMLSLAHYKFPVKYRQHFGGKQIVLVEQVTFAEKLKLSQKNGFISFD